ncbi:MAG: hypothetical protein MK180_17010 [Rhodobacteraceae bacterium]|nr:hypothetical protein [Paracoccaceae bacterium]
MRTMILALFALTAPAAAAADPATITAIEASPSGDAWRFSVTVAHGDTGWDDYADGWEVRLPDGTVLGERVLAHPHVNEQPFTRSATITVPSGVTEVEVFVSESVGGYGAQAYPFSLPGS